MRDQNMRRFVRCIPSSDSAFRDAAVAALNALDGKVTADEIEHVLCASLIGRYPQVDVHRQDDLARVVDDEVWYVYRDGRPSREILSEMARLSRSSASADKRSDTREAEAAHRP
jgi:hypothetical protein